MSALALLPALFSVLFSGCASGGNDSPSPQEAAPLTGLITSRWTPPAFATRPVNGETAAVLNACVDTANALGYSVSRFDGARGRISASRRQPSNFDNAREDSLEITVTVLAPATSQVGLVLRETTETGGSDRSVPIAAAVLVRDRAPYDAFFARLEAGLKPAEAAK
jgi:hypothetical protein